MEQTSKVTNEPRIKNPFIKAIRELLEHRALWLWMRARSTENHRPR